MANNDTSSGGPKADIFLQGQTSGPFGNDPYIQTHLPEATDLRAPTTGKG